MASIQTGLYTILLIICIHKLTQVRRLPDAFIVLFYVLVLAYICCELSVQLFQLVSVAQGTNPINNSNVILSINILCIIVDTLIMVMLTRHWTEIESSFIEINFDHGLATKQTRFVPIIVWAFTYLAYLCYLFAAKQLTLNL